MSVYVIYGGELYHYGVKGMKWGVRKNQPRVTSKTIVSGHSPTPKKSNPNSVADHISSKGVVDVRTFYDEQGYKKKDVHVNDHGNRKQHNYGNHGEHVVIYEWNHDGSIKSKTKRELSDQERKENKDIL